MLKINIALKRYLNQHILTQYAKLDKAHQKNHVKKVLHESLTIAKDYDANPLLVFVIAYFHDVGMVFGRNDHHMTGAKLLYEDKVISTFFTHDDMKLMKEAVEDHRASSKHEPRSIYGKIIAEADRDIDLKTVIKRTVQFGLSYYSHLSKEEVIARTIEHLHEKYGPHGYLKLWLKTVKNTEGLHKIHQMLTREKELTKIIEKIYENEKKRQEY